MPVSALDTEGFLITNSEPTPRLVSVAFDTGESPPSVHAANEPGLIDRLVHTFEQGAAFTNAPFDVFVLLREWPELLPFIVAAYERGDIFDIATREKLIDIAEGEHFRRGKYDLGSLAKRRADLEVDKNDPWRLRYGELLGIPVSEWPIEAYTYAVMDPVATRKVYVNQEAYASGQGYFQPAADIAKRHLSLYAQTLRGIHTDPAQVAQVMGQMLASISERSSALVACGLARWQGKAKPKIVGNMKVAREMMSKFSDVRTPKKLISLSEEAMTLAEIPEGHPLDNYRKLQGEKAAFTKNMPPLNCPVIRTRYDECKNTSRTGSSAPNRDKPHTLDPEDWVGTNLQNLPTEGGVRECLIARPGHVFVISDWGGAELVTNAQNQIDVLGFSPLADTLRAGKDPHAEFAAKALGISSASFDKQKPEHKEYRNLAKKWNFGRWGGMGDEKFRAILRRDLNIDWPVHKVQHFNEIWKDQWGAANYFKWVRNNPSSRVATSKGEVFTKWSMKHHRTGFTKGGCSYTDACNFPFQHLAAVAAGTALWKLWLAALDPVSPLYGHPTSQVLFVHDENVAEVPVHLAEEALVLQERIMIEAFAEWCPDVPVSVESCISERYKK